MAGNKKSQELFQNASYEESVEALNRAIELDPGNSTCIFTKAFSSSTWPI